MVVVPVVPPRGRALRAGVKERAERLRDGDEAGARCCGLLHRDHAVSIRLPGIEENRLRDNGKAGVEPRGVWKPRTGLQGPRRSIEPEAAACGNPRYLPRPSRRCSRFPVMPVAARLLLAGSSRASRAAPVPMVRAMAADSAAADYSSVTPFVVTFAGLDGTGTSGAGGWDDCGTLTCEGFCSLGAVTSVGTVSVRDAFPPLLGGSVCAGDGGGTLR